MVLKKIFRPRNIIILIIVLAVGGYVAAQIFVLGKKEAGYDTVKAAKGDIVQTVEATGTVKALAEVQLAFEASGTLASTTVEVGDFVVKNQTMAELDNESLRLEANQAKAALDLALANLNLKVVGETAQAINVSEADVAKAGATLDNAEISLDKAELDYENARITTQDSVDAAELSLAAAANTLASKQAAHDNTLLSNAEDLKDTYEDTVVILEGALSTMTTALTDVDNILGVDDPSANDVFARYLSVLDSAVMPVAVISYNSSKEKKDAAQAVINTLSIGSDYDVILTAADLAIDALDQIHQCLTDTREVLDNTITGADLTLTELNAKKTTLDTDLISINTKQTSALTQKQAIEALDITNSGALNTSAETLNAAQDAYDQAVKNLETVQNTANTTLAVYAAAVDSAEASVSIQQAALDASEAALALKQASPRGVDLAPLQAQVKSAEAAYSLALNRLENSQIISPANGIVTKINYDVGERVAANATAIVVLATDLFNVEVDIPETDITKISAGDFSEITLDAFGDDMMFVGEVIEIEPAETRIQDVVYYQVKVKIEFTTEQAVKNGMTANVIIKTDERKGVLVIPQRSVIMRNGDKIVRVLKDGEIIEKIPVLGLRGDDGFTEVVNGIDEGDEVVTAVREE
ncbi:HlyD family efflux transporter periplasmic adaptor subunit [Patescibacteria group bacterium]|nr:HlyD family efflux transporter periplasmic adaptor subunit [Patescibacteria group bacterium]MBU1922194.1 HlyD family efflux transporter periplasmic adaptor subunit [Patescibacteria group bacterium]